MSTNSQSIFITNNSHYNVSNMCKAGKPQNIRQEYVKQLMNASLVVYVDSFGKYLFVRGDKDYFKQFTKTI